MPVCVLLTQLYAAFLMTFDIKVKQALMYDTVRTAPFIIAKVQLSLQFTALDRN